MRGASSQSAALVLLTDQVARWRGLQGHPAGVVGSRHALPRLRDVALAGVQLVSSSHPTVWLARDPGPSCLERSSLARAVADAKSMSARTPPYIPPPPWPCPQRRIHLHSHQTASLAYNTAFATRGQPPVRLSRKRSRRLPAPPRTTTSTTAITHHGSTVSVRSLPSVLCTYPRRRAVAAQAYACSILLRYIFAKAN
jgi:hypothetical protein